MQTLSECEETGPTELLQFLQARAQRLNEDFKEIEFRAQYNADPSDYEKREGTPDLGGCFRIMARGAGLVHHTRIPDEDTWFPYLTLTLYLLGSSASRMAVMHRCLPDLPHDMFEDVEDFIRANLGSTKVVQLSLT